ncbi:MAG TPA: cell envelope biogenesis protein OmpA, partial [Candidatus Phocaeicola excrementigallinarum]|nr:cell envelope biogenesis protein OmpA [Candidatus Phocaeicola excrementigallinarum]
MNKKCFLAAAVLAVAGPVCAQDANTVNSDGYTETVEYSNDKYKVETNRFWSNWFISVGAGPQVLFSDHDRQMKFGERISPALDIAVGKWFTPGIGVRFMYSGLSLDGATQNGS